MASEVRLPELGENVEGGDVVSVLVQPGDKITADQAILELETDKATVEVPAGASGTIQRVLVSPGDHVKVGQPVLVLEPDTAATGGAAQEATKGEPASERPKESQPAKEPVVQPLSRPEPATEERLTAGGGESDVALPRGAAGSAAVVDFRLRKTGADKPRPVPASPAVRRFAREIGVDISRVQGSGPKGRITIEDVKAYSRSIRTRPGGAAPARVELPDFSRFGPVEREAFNNVRRATAEHLAVAWSQVVHVTNHDRADVTNLEEWRRAKGAQVEAAGGKLTVTVILLKVVAAALRVFPKFNASLDIDRKEIVYKRYCHVGVAVDTPRGLLVPVIRDVDRKSLVELAVELQAMAERARAGKVKPDELQGGCFTITNLGGIGGTSFTPVVNFPEVAILGVSRSSMEPVYVDGGFEARLILPLSLSYDHRLIDGADAARFLRWVCEALEDPWKLFLGV